MPTEQSLDTSTLTKYMDFCNHDEPMTANSTGKAATALGAITGTCCGLWPLSQ